MLSIKKKFILNLASIVLLVVKKTFRHKSLCPFGDLAATIIRDGKVPSDLEQSFIVCLYKGKGDALERGNYRGLELTEQVMKVLERMVDGLIRKWCQLMTPSLVLSQVEAQQMQSLSSGSCKKCI